MAWRRGSPITVDRLRGDMRRIRSEQNAARQQHADAVEGERRALEAADAFRAVQRHCELKDEEYTEALGTLQDEINELIPRQREGE